MYQHLKEDRITMFTKKEFILTMSELQTTEFPLDELFSLQINHNNVKYEFLVRFASENKNLICLGSGAYDPKKFSPPVYSRHGWQNEFKESVIYYNDPTLYNASDLFLGWGIGKNEEWYLLVIANIIRMLASKNNIKNKDILFFGSSGGGFTAIILSTLLKNSEVIVNNPQMLCQNYANFNFILSRCFDNLELESILKEYKHRFDVLEMFKHENYMPQLTYIVNINSEVDFNGQFLPFINKLASLENFDYRVKMLLYPNDNGHVGILDKTETIQIVEKHFNTKDTIKSHRKLEYTKKQLENIAKTKPYRLAYILRRFSQEFIRGNQNDKKEFLKWIYFKITKKPSHYPSKHNPLIELVKK